MTVYAKADGLVIEDKTPSGRVVEGVIRAAGFPGKSVRTAAADVATRPLVTDTVENRAAVAVPPMLP